MRLIILLLILSLFVGLAPAKVPQVINYQGKVTDPSGDPIADGTYGMGFSMYDDSTGGNMLWSESHPSVQVTGGLFNVLLGSDFPITPEILNESDIFLNIKVDVENIAPRTRIVASPYAIRAHTADSLGEETYLDETGDTLTGHLYFFGGNTAGGHIDVGNGYSNLELATDAATKAHIYGQLFGEIVLYDGDGTPTVDLNAHNSSGGELELYDGGGLLEIELYAGASTNDLMVNLPEDAINADEILNEPGIASNSKIDFVTITSVMGTEIDTVAITTPTDGYILVLAKAHASTSGTTEKCRARVQIDETSGGGLNYPYFNNFGFSEHAGTGYNYWPLFVQRIYAKPAGTYTFRLEGVLFAGNGAGAEVRVGNTIMSAIFIPSSYGEVNTIVKSSEVSPFDEATVVDNPSSETLYKVDLRELEIKAKQKRIEALEAELELQKARENESRR